MAESRIRRLVLVGVVSAAVAAPSALAAPAKYVQIGGDLVTPSQVSAHQARAGAPRSADLVQVAGKLVSPDQVSKAQATAYAPVGAPDDDGLGWPDTGFELGLIGSLLLAAGVLGVLWRRGRLSTV